MLGTHRQAEVPLAVTVRLVQNQQVLPTGPTMKKPIALPLALALAGIIPTAQAAVVSTNNGNALALHYYTSQAYGEINDPRNRS